jgi:glycolate oxidase iron-sulfur subunit
MEAAFREVNAATIRVLAVNGIAVDLPERQTCCGAVAEHAGMPAEKEKLDEANREAFAASALVLTNSSGCGLSLRHALGNAQQDVVDFLGTLDLVPGAEQFPPKAWYDHPCHAFHGLGIRTAPARLLKAAGLEGRWSLAPEADRCCGGGGAYAELQPESSRAILEEKRALLGPLPQGALLITSNHVCMMQWSRIPGLQVRHAVQVLDESYRLAGYYSKI